MMTANVRRRAALLWVALTALALSMPAHAGIDPTGTIVTREFSSSALNRKWAYTVYLPSGYETSTLQYPVLYLFHGNAGTLNDWPTVGRIQPTADALIAAGEIPPAIIVMPDADDLVRRSQGENGDGGHQRSHP